LDLKALIQLREVISDFNPDLIHTHTFKAGFLMRIIQPSVPLVHTFHGHHLSDPDYGWIKRRLIVFLDKYPTSNTKKFIAVGQKVKRDLVLKSIGDEGDYVIIPPGILPLKGRNRKAILNHFNIEDERLRIVWLGRLTNVKRPDRVLMLAKRFPFANFLIAGNGELLKSLQENSIQNVFFLGNQNASEILSIADILLSTSDSEGMPLSIIEGQMMGVPCVVTNVGSVAEIVQNEKTGLVVPNNDEALIEGLDRMLSDARLRTKMSRASRIRSQEKFSRDKMVSSHLELYEKVVERN
jgi:glycosyltransferase involved in cell wall biosynthesis